jgi:subtilase family serine protease
MRHRPTYLIYAGLALLLAACAPTSGVDGPRATATPMATPTSVAAASDVCPGRLAEGNSCFTPHVLRVAYGVQALTDRGFTGKGQTVIDIVSYGSPTLQQDLDVFDQQFGLPPLTVQVVTPLGTVPFDPTNPGMAGWAGETELDVQIIHAIAPEANIVVMTSPVNETEGTIGLPQFLQLEQYAVAHHLGQIFSQSWTASEATLTDSASQQFIQTYARFYQQAAQQGLTILSGSGDNGATDYADLAATKLAPTRTVNFPADVPWVTAVGGTSLAKVGAGYSEVAWQGSGGGASQFFSQPDFQQGLSSSARSPLGGHRGLPDVAANADPATGMAFYINGSWQQVGGTSASTPLWAGIVAIGDQMAGHGLGNINPGLYKLGESRAQQDFRDVTSGNNSTASNGVQVQGFDASPGWDLVTGWGAPLADHLLPDLIAALT